ncbi:MAG: hypothetical protein KFB96_17505 [Thiocapsa sp.]|uniref:hypothetical protein n=1 Tax=Thiocapsa sp. TaxID=2024551 RepID=UPI001BCA7425|nr:hypothetical protein [Thiocapsa sp.]QVL47486.1 MAG: hypothetical protein KFB96_17505 [Thiocapsa sp.]
MSRIDRTDTDIAPPDRERYTLDGDAAVEARIAHDQSLIAEAVTELVSPPVFRGVVLMGGYGRGEGGYILREGRPEPYNDYDYFVVVRRLDRAGRKALALALADRAKTLEQAVGVEVDFALLRDERLPKAEFSLMNAEMIWGHRVVAGDPAVLDAMPPMPFRGLALGEFTRLMLNRGALLLMNRQRLAGGATLDAAAREVFFKYLFKAMLACGDARLAGARRYHPSYVTKLERLREGDWPGQAPFMALYTQAWENKFHPSYVRYAAENTEAWQARVVAIWLETLDWLEGIRVGRAIGDWTAYASHAIPKGQDQASWGALRHLAITARDFGLAELLREPGWSRRYPRERLISALPLLLTHPDGPAPPVLARALALPPRASFEEATATFLRLWRRYA